MKVSVELSPHGELRCWFPDGSAVAGYHVDIPPTKGGLELLLDILTRRTDKRQTTGMVGQPTQFDIEQAVKEFKKKPKPAIVDGVNITDLAGEIEL